MNTLVVRYTATIFKILIKMQTNYLKNFVIIFFLKKKKITAKLLCHPYISKHALKSLTIGRSNVTFGYIDSIFKI